MSRRTEKFYPGWKMTRDQWASYWWHIGQCAKALDFTTAAQREELREQIHVRAFGDNISAKTIDHLKMFDAFKAECLAILKPTDVAAQIAQVNMPRTRLIEGILAKFDEDFILSLLRSDRFKKKSLADLQMMDEKDLTDLRNTLCARASGWHEVPAESDLAGEEQFQPEPEMENQPF